MAAKLKKTIMAQQAVCDVVAKVRSVLVAKEYLQLFDEIRTHYRF